jgi:hypothetical protein
MADIKPLKEPLALPITWTFPEGTTTRFTAHMLVQWGEHVCYVSFFEVRPPLILEDSPEERAKHTSVTAECVARLAIPAHAVPAMIETLQSTWNAYLETQKATAPQPPKEDA